MRHALAAAALAATLAFSGAASAATCTVGTCTITGLSGDILDVGNPVAIEDENVALGPYLAEGVIAVASAFQNFGPALPDYNINLDPIVPVPAALPLLLSGLFGLAFASRAGKRGRAARR